MCGLHPERRKYCKTWFLALIDLVNSLNKYVMKKNLYKKEGKQSYKALVFGCINLFIFSTSAFSQTLPGDSAIQMAFNQYRSRAVQEKIFVHTDKDTYIVREICWFRIYYVDAMNQKTASLSKIAYVEILDKNNLPVLQEKVSLKPGESGGSIVLPLNISTGTYKFRAYTNWMKNFGPEYFFEKPIRIINPQTLQTDSAVVKQKRYDIQFFPEGGNLVNQIESRVGFRVTDAYGKGLDCEGLLLNTNGDTVLKFQPKQFGLGNFLFTPITGQSYKALIRFPRGEEVMKELPAAYNSGYVISLTKSTEGQIALRVQSSPDLDLQDMYLFIHGNRSSLPVQKGQLKDHKAGFLVKPEDLEDGISQFTVFNASGQPLCERLYFKYPENKFVITAETNPEYTTRKKIDLNLTATNQAGKPVSADMSMAVYRLDSIQQVDASDIRYYFYLTADLGPVESPEFYFTENGKSSGENMDNLMLTHGWRRYTWKDMVKPKSSYR